MKNKMNTKDYEILKNEDDIYYKKDTHINLKGNYIIFNYFSDFCKKININIPLIDINIIKHKYIENINSIIGVGDLTWNLNLGNQILNDYSDSYYYDETNYEIIYNKTIINDKINLQLLHLENNILLDNTIDNYGKLLDWNIISKYILYRKNNIYHNNLKILIFCDSFLLSIIHLFMNIFREIYFIKSIFDEKYINIIKPDFIFEFRVERFLF